MAAAGASDVSRGDLELLEDYPLRCLVRVPDREARPVLCFLHGYDEGAPMNMCGALTAHGPLRNGNPNAWIDRFVIVAPQLPMRGDVWHRYAAIVRQIVQAERERHGCDMSRAYLTGFSFGANGVFDLALEQNDLWTAVWAVDPTRVPTRALEIPVWVSMGEVARYQTRAFIDRLRLEPAIGAGERIFTDEGLDHVGAARSAYRDPRVYEWLLSH
jgi:predicted peptidase